MLRLSRGERGASLTGYGLVVGLIAILAIAAVSNVGNGVTELFTGVANSLDSSGSSSGSSEAQNQTATVSLTPANTSLVEGTDTSTPVVVASINIMDDGNGTNTLSLGGVDASKFSISGTDLLFSDGTPDFDSPTDSGNNNVYDVTIEVDDPSIAGNPDSTTAFTLTIQSDEIKLLASDGVAGDLMGRSVFLDGDMALVSARGVNSGAGALYVFDCGSGTCVETDKFAPNDLSAGDNFGVSLYLENNIALASADVQNSSTGAAYLLDCTGGTCTQTQKLTASNGATGDSFSTGMAISGNRILIGAHGDNSSTGAAYLFDCTGGTCTEIQIITASDGASSDVFGRALDMEGDIALIGAQLDDDDGTDSGSVYLFDCSGASCVEVEKITRSAATNNDSFGSSISISGNFGLVGAQVDDAVGTNSGSGYLFSCTVSGCSETDKLLASNASSGDELGRSVSMSGNYALLGARYDDSPLTDSGSAYLFDCTGGTCTEIAHYTAADAVANDEFAISVSQSGTTSLISGWRNDDNGTDSGSAYLFSIP